jgi:hypothetical protein
VDLLRKIHGISCIWEVFTPAAVALRTDYKTLHLKMKQYGIPAREFRRP